MKARAWSFSRIKAFEQCPKQFYHERVLKEFPQKETDAMRYGTAFHEAAELYIRDDTPLPAKFGYAKDALDRLNRMTGDKLCEYELGLGANLEACEYKSREVWFRGIADLLIINGDKAKVLDYKTGKSAKYADTGQLELMAMAVFKHFPEVHTVQGGLLFVVPKKFITSVYVRADAPKLWEKWLTKYNRLEKAHSVNVWNANPSGLCKAHCPVTTCPHNGRH